MRKLLVGLETMTASASRRTGRKKKPSVGLDLDHLPLFKDGDKKASVRHDRLLYR